MTDRERTLESVVAWLLNGREAMLALRERNAV